MENAKRELRSFLSWPKASRMSWFTMPHASVAGFVRNRACEHPVYLSGFSGNQLPLFRQRRSDEIKNRLRSRIFWQSDIFVDF
jgi:hypothetical protein